MTDSLLTEAGKHLRLLLNDVIFISWWSGTSVGRRRVNRKIVLVFADSLVFTSDERFRLLPGLSSLWTFLRISLPLSQEAKV